ncbi:DUF3429 domain-containing protein [Qipengyuania gelatinilytica]|uniref:DUF3429 domain-containing protein n=1 Tax=Qipengyuania gelatinilytica TaxID=2867231 RepID=A0ABX8ZZR4_9SPHN|nr:DUF3429 domain-containing protein [Qipengyuania gelatinilytica]QZD94515.1 DUF3429 domain-containing protein [Qipengyuania gelatinilytica]
MREVPSRARLLGLAGLLPQIACLLAVYLGPAEWRETALVTAALYAALILSFLGGTWWGLAAGAPAAERRSALGWLWLAAVLPSLVALAALAPFALGYTGAEPSLMMLGGALLVALAVDGRLSSLAPRWWLSLRVPLSIGLGVLTFLIALG